MKKNKKFRGVVFVLTYVFLFIASDCVAGMKQRGYAPRNDMKTVEQQTPAQLRALLLEIVTPCVGPGPDKSPALALGLTTESGDVTLSLGNHRIRQFGPVNSDTLFGIGSLTKIFTGLILAQAVTADDIKLADKASDYLPPEIEIDNRITIQQLVSHTSGLPDFPENLMNQDGERMRVIDDRMPAKGYTKSQLQECLKNGNCRPTVFPGKEYHYSNLGLGLLALVLQTRYGYPDFVAMNRARITDVLGMDDTSTHIQNFIQARQDRIAQGYQYPERSAPRPVPLSQMGILAGAGELISSVDDVMRLLKVLTGLSNSPMQAAVAEFNRKLCSGDRPDVDIGYAHKMRKTNDGGTVHFMSGFTAGYTAVMLWRDAPKVGLIIMANRGRFNQLTTIGVQAMDALRGQIKAP